MARNFSDKFFGAFMRCRVPFSSGVDGVLVFIHFFCFCTVRDELEGSIRQLEYRYTPVVEKVR